MVATGLRAMMDAFVVHPERISQSMSRGFATATDLADALVSKKGLPFRDSHHIAGRLVALCAGAGLSLDQAPKEMRSGVHEALADDDFFHEAINEERSVERKISRGGTALARIAEQIDRARETMERRRRDLPAAPDLNF